MHRICILILALLGVIVSWVYFVPITLEVGFLEAWASAFQSSPFSIGLHWDLIFTDLIVFTMAIARRRELGRGYVVGTMVMGLTLGVCAALATYWFGLKGRPQRGVLAAHQG